MLTSFQIHCRQNFSTLIFHKIIWIIFNLLQILHTVLHVFTSHTFQQCKWCWRKVSNKQADRYWHVRLWHILDHITVNYILNVCAFVHTQHITGTSISITFHSITSLTTTFIATSNVDTDLHTSTVICSTFINVYVNMSLCQMGSWSISQWSYPNHYTCPSAASTYPLLHEQ